jgi:hypothetical protein
MQSGIRIRDARGSIVANHGSRTMGAPANGASVRLANSVARVTGGTYRRDLMDGAAHIAYGVE